MIKLYNIFFMQYNKLQIILNYSMYDYVVKSYNIWNNSINQRFLHMYYIK